MLNLKIFKFMIKLFYILVFLLLSFHNKGISQPTPYNATLLFNLSEIENPYKSLTVKDLEIKGIYFLSNQPAKLKYDTINKAFAFTAYGYEIQNFAIIYKKDTIYIDYPSREYIKAVFIKTPIPLNGKSFAFYNKFTYDAMHSNNYDTNNFYLCQGCIISQYEMPEQLLKKIEKFNRKRKWFVVKLEK